MSNTKQPIFLVFLLVFSYAKAQDTVDTLLIKDNVMIALPTVSINFGFNYSMSDVSLNNTGPSPFQQFGYQLTVTQNITNFLNISLNLFTGTIYGEEQRDETNLNFRTSLFSQHLNIEYNFYPLLKPDAQGRQLIRPHLGFGVGLISFRSKGDMNDGSGTPYQYWSDGNIYAEIEGTVDATEATLLERDYVYETELRDANLDGLRKYPQTAFSLPINAGIRFQVSKNIGLNAAFTYTLNFSDMLDNVSVDGVGNRQGKAGFDNNLFGSVGLSVFLGRIKPSTEPTKFLADELASKNDTNEVTTGNSSSSSAVDDKAEKNTTNTSATNSLKKIADLNQNLTSESALDDSYVENLAKAESQISDNKKTSDKLEAILKNSSNEITKTEKRALIEAIKQQADALSALKKATNLYASDKKLFSEDKGTNIEVIESKKTNLITNLSRINLELEQLNSLEKEAKKTKTSEQGLKVISDLNEVAASSLETIEKSKQIVIVSSSERELNQIEDKLSLYEFVRESESLSAEDLEQLSNVRKKLATEINRLNADGVLDATTKARYEKRLSIITLAESSKLSNDQTSPEQDNTTEITVESEGEDSKSTEPRKADSKYITATAETETHIESSTIAEQIENTPPKESGEFHWADINENGWISPDEVLHFIDLLFDGEPVRTVVDIQNLIDYYFDQE